MSATPEVIATPAGELRVLPLSPESLRGLAELFPRLDAVEHEGAELLVLVMGEGERRMHGLRTGHGYFEAGQAQTARRAALFGRMRMPRALAAFRARAFDGVVLAASCVADNGSGSVQEGELLFMHARQPLTTGLESEPLPVWERFCGSGTTAALLTLIGDVDAAWKSGGVEDRVLTDLEPCPADLPEVSWFADLVLVDQRFVLVRRAIDPTDPFLGMMVEAGIHEVEFTPSAFALVSEKAGESAR